MEILKVFISMPMNGKTKNEIEEEFASMHNKAIADIRANNDASKIYNRIGEQFNGGWTPTIFVHGETGECDNAVEALAKSLLIISECDIVYFAKDWTKATGCKIEYEICRKYGKLIIGEKPKKCKIVESKERRNRK